MPELAIRVVLALLLALFLIIIVLFIVIGIPGELREDKKSVENEIFFGSLLDDNSHITSSVCVRRDYTVNVNVNVISPDEKKNFNYTVIGEIDNKIVRGTSGSKNVFKYPEEDSVSLIFDIHNAKEPKNNKNSIHVTFWKASECIKNYFEENSDAKFIDLLNECGHDYLSAVDLPFECGEGSIISTPIDGTIYMEGVDIGNTGETCRPRIAVKNIGTRAWTADDKVKVVVQCVPGQSFTGVYIPLPENGYLTLNPGESYFSPLDLSCGIISSTNRKSAILYENCQNPNSPEFCASGEILESTSFTCAQASGPGGIDCRDSACNNPKLTIQWGKIKYWLALCMEGIGCTYTLTDPDVCDFGQTTDGIEATCELVKDVPYTVTVMASPSQEPGPFGGYEYVNSQNVQCSNSNPAASTCFKQISWPRISYNVQLVRHGTFEGACSQRTDPLCDDSKSTTLTSAEFQGLAPLFSYDAYVMVNASGTGRLHKAVSAAETADCDC